MINTSTASHVEQIIVDELKGMLAIITHQMAMPLYLLFWICDIIYVPQFKYEFLIVRLFVIPVSIYVNHKAKKISTVDEGRKLAFALTVFYSLTINYMIFRIDNSETLYYAGLNLVAIGTLTFISLDTLSFVKFASAIYAPYLFYLLFNIHNYDQFSQTIPNVFFAVGTVTISIIIRYFNEKLRLSNINSMIELKHEINGRDQIIKIKTEEALKLAYLSSQFSPQVVESIKNGQIKLTGEVKRTKICSVFIDIVNSTERVVRVDEQKVHRVISMFMEDTIKTLLKYDITVDKFLGDGILAFSNDPVRHENYIERVLSASLEIREKIKTNAEFYEKNWQQPLEVRIGISTGYANVGFYGNDRYYKSYTAIGPVVNLSSRLCSIAEPNQIVCDHEIMEALIEKDDFSFNFLGKRNLKGFGDDVIFSYELIDSKIYHQAQSNHDLDCPACKTGMLYLEANDKNIFVFKCRNCGFVPSEIKGVLSVTQKAS